MENFVYCPLFRQLVCTSLTLFLVDEQRQPHVALGATPWKWSSLGGGAQHYAAGLIFTLFVNPILILCLSLLSQGAYQYHLLMKASEAVILAFALLNCCY